MEKNMDYYSILDRLDRIEKKLDGKVTDSWMTIKEVSRYTSLSTSTINRSVAKGTLKCSKRLGKRLFKRSWVDKWLGG